MSYLNRYFECGDSTIKIISILEKVPNNILIALKYSANHKVYSVKVFDERDFRNWYADNELTDYEFEDLDYKGLIN